MLNKTEVLEGLLITNIDQFCQVVDRSIEDLEAAGRTEQYNARMHKILDRIDEYIANNRVLPLEVNL